MNSILSNTLTIGDAPQFESMVIHTLDNQKKALDIRVLEVYTHVPKAFFVCITVACYSVLWGAKKITVIILSSFQTKKTAASIANIAHYIFYGCFSMSFIVLAYLHKALSYKRQAEYLPSLRSFKAACFIMSELYPEKTGTSVQKEGSLLAGNAAMSRNRTSFEEDLLLEKPYLEDIETLFIEMAKGYLLALCRFLENYIQANKIAFSFDFKDLSSNIENIHSLDQIQQPIKKMLILFHPDKQLIQESGDNHVIRDLQTIREGVQFLSRLKESEAANPSTRLDTN